MARGEGRRAAHGACALVVVVALAGCSDAPGSAGDRFWVELGPGDSASARLVTDGDRCPEIEIDGVSAPMAVRATPAPPDFPILTCEAALPPNAERASIGGVALPLPRRDPQRIAIIGDTGCRLQTGDPAQACNDPSAWPFADLALAVAEWQPDLVVHVGDYLYREDPCPEGDVGCEGSPFGFNWAAIDADFFTPAEPLLRVAPFALTRGNHESCSLAGDIWFRLLEPRAFEPECVDYTEPYSIETGGLQLLMLDSSNANDSSAEPSQVAIYRAQFEQLRELAGPHAFLTTHRPVWGFTHAGDMDGMEVLGRDNATLQAASDNVLPPGVDLVLSGHIHLFEVLSFDPLPEFPRPPQLIVGNSGTSLASGITTPLAGLEIGGAPVAAGDAFAQFGWVSMERDGAGWRAMLRDVEGRRMLECVFENDRAICA